MQTERIDQGIRAYALCAIAITAVSLWGGSAAGLQYEGERIDAVVVMGNRTVSDVMIFNKLETREKGLFSEETVKADVTRLYELGYFTNISVDVERIEGGVKVAFVVKEKPELREIAFKGNSLISTDRLKREMKSKVGEALNAKLLVEDVESLRKLYAQEGFPVAQVACEIVNPKNEPQAAVLIKINEGARQAIRRINFVGNSHVPARSLVQFMQTKRRAPWPLYKWPMSYLYSKGLLEQEALNDDLDRIRGYYASLGYVDMKVSNVERNISRDGRHIDITISLDEGGTYQVGEVAVAGNKIYDTDELQRVLTMGSGVTYSPVTLQGDMNAIRGMYLSKGYTDAEVIPEKRLNPETGKIDVSYTIKEYEPYYVGRIDIKGNTRTNDYVIRREMSVMPGDVFNSLKIQRSKERLENTGFFETVGIAASPGEGERTQNLAVDVQEGKTGQLSFGAGFSSIDGFVGFAEISQSNFDIKNFPYFTGAGQKFRLRAEVGLEEQNFLLSFTEPYFMGKRLAAGFDLYMKNSEYLSDYFNEERLGGNLRLGKELGQFYRGDLVYKLENVNLYDVPDDASEQIKADAGNTLISSVSFGLTRDTRDSIVFPHHGAISSITAEFAGLGGDADFVKLEAMGSQYFVPIERFPEHVVRVAGGAGVAGPYSGSGEIPLSERFFLGGGDTIRGFDYRDVGPRDINDEPIGGDAMLMASVEYTFPLISKIRGAAFFDMGNVYETPSDFLDGIVASVGMGVRLNLPVGPIKLDYGIPVITDQWTEGENGAFSFNVGTIF
ncbi:MAG: outer membrane protein assembly factor BamA [Candidatus Aureabacteria bacterium]|nr:outer membrane protein assembly factor BamA [Candidatus Auribacterota bacterium]